MKKLKIVVLAGVLAAMCIGLTACFWPEVLPNDPTPREVAPTAVFSYYPTSYPVQTDSKVLFDGSESSDQDGNIIWAEWDFGDGSDVEFGVWTNVVQKFVNGVEVLETVPSKWQKRNHTYTKADPDSYYTVSLTVWDNDGNESAVSRQIKMQK